VFCNTRYRGLPFSYSSPPDSGLRPVSSKSVYRFLNALRNIFFKIVAAFRMPLRIAEPLPDGDDSPGKAPTAMPVVTPGITFSLFISFNFKRTGTHLLSGAFTYLPSPPDNEFRPMVFSFFSASAAILGAVLDEELFSFTTCEPGAGCRDFFTASWSVLLFSGDAGTGCFPDIVDFFIAACICKSGRVVQ
jgi:hypothetical protein